MRRRWTRREKRERTRQQPPRRRAAWQQSLSSAHRCEVRGATSAERDGARRLLPSEKECEARGCERAAKCGGELMFIGHFGLGFGAKKAAPAVSLGTLFAAGQFADFVWPTLVLLGVEHVEVQPGATRMTPLNFVSYPYSHSLVALCLWGIIFGGVYLAISRARPSAAVTLALLVVSHWLLDFVTHRPDMPLTL